MAAQARIRRDNLIPSPFDPRLILRIAPAVAKAAMESGVRDKPIADFVAYRGNADALRLSFRLQSCSRCCKPRQADPKRVIYAEGEDERVLRAVPDHCRGRDRNADPDRPPRRHRHASRTVRPVGAAGARFRAHQSQEDPRYRDYVATYLERPDGTASRPRRRARLVRDQFDGDRGDRGEARRRRRHALRPRRTLQSALALHPATLSGSFPARPIFRDVAS